MASFSLQGHVPERQALTAGGPSQLTPEPMFSTYGDTTDTVDRRSTRERPDTTIELDSHLNTLSLAATEGRPGQPRVYRQVGDEQTYGING